MNATSFESFFTGPAMDILLRGIDMALEEDGRDLTSLALFHEDDVLEARIVAKQEAVIAGLPLIPIILRRTGENGFTDISARDGDLVKPGDVVARLHGPAPLLLKAERVIMNFLCHLSGIATLTRRYVQEVAGTRTRLLDTRKTMPGLRYPEKYAVLCGGGLNHRLDLSRMLMLKDNHIDRAGGITKAVALLRAAYDPCPPIEVECRTLKEVSEAVSLAVDRIMLDNMSLELLKAALAVIPENIESEVSGGVHFENLAEIAALGPDYISVGRLTHSAPFADLSMQVELT